MHLDERYRDLFISSPHFGEESFVEYDFLTDKTKNRFIKTTERLIRTSEEYKKWIKTVHGILGGLYICYFSGESPDYCKIELHHYPLTLYDLVTVALENFEEKTTVGIAQEVLSWHFKNYVGFIPLTSTNHERTHNRVLSIPIEIVEGNWRHLEKEFFINEFLKEKMELASSVTFSDIELTWTVQERKFDVTTYKDTREEDQ